MNSSDQTHRFINISYSYVAITGGKTDVPLDWHPYWTIRTNTVKLTA